MKPYSEMRFSLRCMQLPVVAGYLFMFFFILTVFDCKTQVPNFPLSAQATKTLVDSLASQVGRYYIDKDAAIAMSAAVRKRYKEGAYNKIADPHMLAALLTSDIRTVRDDEHFHVEYNPAIANEVSGNIEDVPKMVAEKLQAERAKNFGFKRVDILNGNIGYLELSGFSRLNRYSKETADAAFKLLSNSSALIIDLRYGVGGSPEMVTHILSHFFRERTHIANIYIRSENATLPYYTTPDSSYSGLFDIPIYVLTSYKTFSAAEGLAYALQSHKRGIIVGEKTRGGAHTVTYRPLSSGFIADIPFGHSTDPITHKSWEGVGIAPDISAEAEKALEIAGTTIFEKRLKSCSDSSEARIARWNRDLLLSLNHPYTVTPVVMQQYAGSYGAYVISYMNGELFCQKTGKAKFPLVAMKEDQFRPLSNDTFMLFFARDNAGRVTQLSAKYDDGREEKAPRTKQ